MHRDARVGVRRQTHDDVLSVLGHGQGILVGPQRVLLALVRGPRKVPRAHELDGRLVAGSWHFKESSRNGGKRGVGQHDKAEGDGHRRQRHKPKD